MKVVGLWSGGKDSCFACYKAIKSGYDLIKLINFTEPDSEYSLSHGIPYKLIEKQLRATGISFLQKEMPRKTYRDEFVKLMKEFRKMENIEGIVFGDIYLKEHKEWIDDVCMEIGVTPIMPLWGLEPIKIINEFIDNGFKTVIVAAKKEFKDLLGRVIDKHTLKLFDRFGIDYCGERGEYHTFVFDGPLFDKKIDFEIKENIREQRDCYIEIS